MLIRTLMTFPKIFHRETPFFKLDLMEIGMQTPIIHKNQGKTKSATNIPSQVA